MAPLQATCGWELGRRFRWTTVCRRDSTRCRGSGGSSSSRGKGRPLVGAACAGPHLHRGGADRFLFRKTLVLRASVSIDLHLRRPRPDGMESGLYLSSAVEANRVSARESCERTPLACCFWRLAKDSSISGGACYRGFPDERGPSRRASRVRPPESEKSARRKTARNLSQT